MKHNILILSILFVTMGVLTSSRENANGCREVQPLNNGHACLPACNEYAINITCGNATPSVKENKANACAEAAADSEISLSPIGRFILLQ